VFRNQDRMTRTFTVEIRETVLPNIEIKVPLRIRVKIGPQYFLAFVRGD
jgi:hypothetical protein